MLAFIDTHQLNLARKFAAFLPASLVDQILLDDLPPIAQAKKGRAAAIFADIAGFTRMSEALAQYGEEGVEALNDILLRLFTPMIDAIHGSGGAVMHFYGDAMLVCFGDRGGTAQERAISCALDMQRLMGAGVKTVIAKLPNDTELCFNLSLRIGIGYGQCVRMLVGSEENGYEFVVSGKAIEDATQAEKMAENGSIRLSPSMEAYARMHLAQPLVQYEGQKRWIVGTETSRLLKDDSEMLMSHQLTRLLEIGPKFVPPIVSEKLTTEIVPKLATYSSVTSIFVQFQGLDPSQPDFGAKMNDYYLWACGVVQRCTHINGRVNRVLTADKGNQLHIIVNTPTSVEIEQAICCALTLQREKPSYITVQRIGAVAGKAMMCPLGSNSRHEFTIIGDMVNLSCRLSQHCKPNQILTNCKTAAHVQDTIKNQRLRYQTLKGKIEPVLLFEIITETRPAPHFGPHNRPNYVTATMEATVV